MELSIEYQYCWLWRFLITWSAPEFEIGFYDVDCETKLFCVIFRRSNTACSGRGLLSPIERDWSGKVEDEAWAYLQKSPRR